MNWQRLISMSPAEIFGRSLQISARSLDRIRDRGIKVSTASVLSNLKKGDPNRQIKRLFTHRAESEAELAFFETFKLTSALRFFSGIGNPDFNDLYNSVCNEDHRRKVISNAESILQGEFEILGFGLLNFGQPINWHYDPVNNIEISRKHWSVLDTLDPQKVGDIKVVWELNRHQWMLDLGQAYLINNDEKYARGFADLLTHWMQENPPGEGINWASSLEVSFRLISWCWALNLFRDSPSLSENLFVTMVGWIRLHAKYIKRYLSRYYAPNTHLTGEALGLFYAGTLFPELKEAKAWQDTGRTILIDEIEKQVYDDGVYFEQSTSYQYYTIDFYLHFIMLAERNGINVPEKVTNRLEKMVEFVFWLRQPDGSVPNIGDADGGMLMPLVRRPPCDFAALFSTAALYFSRADFAWAASVLALESIFLLGSGAITAFEKLAGTQPQSKGVKIFKEGGYIVFSNGCNPRSHQMLIDAGPLGCGFSGGHGHADLLSLNCCVFGEPFLVDSGTFCYAIDAEKRSYFRSSQAHSTLTIDNKSQARSIGPFQWSSPRPEARLMGVQEHKACFIADVSHNAYQTLDDPVIHRRRVVYVKAGYWIIIDDLAGCARHSVQLRYQYSPISVYLDMDWVRAVGNMGQCLLARAYSSADLSCNIIAGKTAPFAGWVSSDYGRCSPAPVLVYETEDQFPLRIVTLLYPFETENAEPPEVAVSHEGGVITELDINRHEIIKIGQTDIVVLPVARA